MDWPSFYSAVGGAVGGIAAVGGAAVWLLKAWLGAKVEKSVAHEYETRLAAHKAELQKEVYAATQQLKREFAEIDEQLDVDRSLFRQLMEALPSDTIQFAYIEDMNIPFFPKSIDPLRTFARLWNRPEKAFLDTELRSLQRNLHEKVVAYLDELDRTIVPSDIHMNLYQIPPEWQHTSPERFHGAISRINRLSGEVAEVHQQLVATARQKLRV